ncbi:MAG: hypothetical protein ABJQ29_06095 [Luteolibacter sp.]
MNDNIEQNFKEIGKDLETRWIELSKEIRDLSAELKQKAADSPLCADVDRLSIKTDSLCDHVERIHADVIDLLENLDTRLDLTPEHASQTDKELEKEKIQIQREQHTQSNIKDVIKALFMYVDDPKERVAQKR